MDSSIVGLWPSIPAAIELLRQVFRVSKRADVSRHIVQPTVIANPVAGHGVRRLCVDWRGRPPRFHVTVWPRTRGRTACPHWVDREPGSFLQLCVRALRMGCLLKGGQRDPVPLRQKAQVHIATERSLMAKFA